MDKRGWQDTHYGCDFTSGKKQNAQKGIYAFTARDVFEILETADTATRTLVYFARSSKYMDQMFSISKQERQNCASNVEEVLALIHEEVDREPLGHTSANSNSSRSIAVFQIIFAKERRRTRMVSVEDTVNTLRYAHRVKERETSVILALVKKEYLH
uniref:Uncharacterized protein n=1 Tax=Ditylenchus dipsaci TaxID=166011 RepID=A0A915DV43_9BILA